MMSGNNPEFAMKTKHTKCILRIALSLTLAFVVCGESYGIENIHFSIGPRATYSRPQDADEAQAYVGIQARFILASALSLEASFDYRSNNFFNFTTIKTYPIQLSALVYFLHVAILNPFLIGGTGWYYTQVDGPFGFNNTYSRLSLHAGAGLELKLTEVVSIDGCYRYIWLESVASKDVSSRDRSFQDSGAMVTVGLNFLF